VPDLRLWLDRSSAVLTRYDETLRFGLYQESSGQLLRGVITANTGASGRADLVAQPASNAHEVSLWERAADHFRSWQAGQHSELDHLVRTLTPVLWHVVRAYGLDRDRAEDVVQTTWLTLVRRHESIVDPQAVASWLTTTARREAWRVAKQADRLPAIPEPVIADRAGTQESAEQSAVAADEDAYLWACVNQLSPRCQRLLRIVAFSERPDYAEIARDLERPIGSIGPTRGRCLSKLRSLMTQDRREQP
jgi:RNA polymerase sigma factor (sigma-70 family)